MFPQQIMSYLHKTSDAEIENTNYTEPYKKFKKEYNIITNTIKKYQKDERERENKKLGSN